MLIRYELSGTAALVTGAASGIGLATAVLLARSGAKVAVNFLADDPRGTVEVEKLRAEGLDVIAAPGDVGDAKAGVAMVMDAIDRLGRLDLLANNAGTPGVRHTIDMARLDLVTEELWATILGVNLLGPFRCSKAAAPALKAARGAIVNTASIAGTGSGGSSMPYGASKAGLVNLTKNLAKALAPEVRVNAVAPGGVDSSWQIEWTPEQRRYSVERSLLKKRADPAEIGDLILYLGFGASMVTGQTVICDAGLTL
ncbi:MAG: SDR family NAD(P)-dependent oxidoreductase [Stellaceae bacterium]